VNISKKGLKLFLLLLSLAIYIGLFIGKYAFADPSGTDVTNISTETYSSAVGSRQDPGGTITTLTLDTTQQDIAWKAYVGNITGKLVLRNSGGWSIYEWATNASGLTGFIFVSRNDTVSWGDVVCANSTVIDTEQAFLGMVTADSDSINKTFNSSNHAAMDMSGPSIIAANSCPSTATYVNGTSQTVNSDASFQEILLYDRTDFNFVYGTFINQNAWGYNNNESINSTYDFQLIVAENTSVSVGTVYYFYADIS
jgi:hypothetical protein